MTMTHSPHTHKRLVEIARAAEQAGARDVQEYRREPARLPQLTLGAFHAGDIREVLLRRLLLSVRCPVWLITSAAPLVRTIAGEQEYQRFVSDYAYWHGARRALDRETWRRLVSGTVILMYHACGGAGEPASTYVIPAHRFARQMAWLRWRRYHVMDLDAYLRCRQEHRLPPARSVVITFDDGYADNRALAHPVLRRHGFPATIFLVSGAMGQVNDWDERGTLRGRPLLSWSDARQMRGEGILFGAHSRTHARLTALDSEQLMDEVAGSKVDLEQHLGEEVRVFAYPGGKRDDAVDSTVERAGFAGACSTLAGINDPATPLFALRRGDVRGNNTALWHFALTLLIGWPTLRPPRPAPTGCRELLR